MTLIAVRQPEYMRGFLRTFGACMLIAQRRVNIHGGRIVYDARPYNLMPPDGCGGKRIR